jgi:spore maturation protein CgeB
VRVVMLYQSLVSDWNHGNAHFLRGVAGELARRGHAVAVYEPRDGWSRTQLIAEHGLAAVASFHRAYPHLDSTLYDCPADIDAAVDDADLVIVHEWTPDWVIARVGELRRDRPALRVLFHDTHHRSASDPQSLAAYDLRAYDGVLAYARVIRDRYLAEGWAGRAWTWHEAADVDVFQPLADQPRDGDLVWIGNWAGEERARELDEFLIGPVRRLGLKATVYGVRYPPAALDSLAAAGIAYGGWVPNHAVPRLFARHAVTVHVPRRPYVRELPGVPTIRPFEALACGIPLVSAPWSDVEGLFRPGWDYLLARDGDEMTTHLDSVLTNPAWAATLAANGRRRILARHTCAHRVDELLAIYRDLVVREAAAARS